MSPWPAYVAGYVTKEDFERGAPELRMTVRVSSVVIGGCGYFGDIEARKVEGLGEIAKEKYLSSLGAFALVSRRLGTNSKKYITWLTEPLLNYAIFVLTRYFLQALRRR